MDRTQSSTETQQLIIPGTNQSQSSFKCFPDCVRASLKWAGGTLMVVGIAAMGTGGYMITHNSTVVVPPPVDQPVGLFLIEFGGPIAFMGALSFGAGYAMNYLAEPTSIIRRHADPSPAFDDKEEIESSRTFEDGFTLISEDDGKKPDPLPESSTTSTYPLDREGDEVDCRGSDL